MKKQRLRDESGLTQVIGKLEISVPRAIWDFIRKLKFNFDRIVIFLLLVIVVVLLLVIWRILGAFLVNLIILAITNIV